MVKINKKIPSWLKNRYVLALLSFVVWVCFFDNYDLFTQISARAELSEMRDEKEHYAAEIEKTEKALKELTTNEALLERFAREKYLMKRDNEDIYVVVEK